MGGEHDRLTAAEAASVLGWWIEAGVDVAIQEQPRAWLGAVATVPADVIPPAQSPAVPRSPREPRSLPSWLGETSVSAARTGQCTARTPAMHGSAEVMLLADMPTPEDVASGQPISGQAWELTERYARRDRFRQPSSLRSQPIVLPQSRNASFRQ
jgi:DNA polymerase